tara:strand:+ start:2482 stop:2787 length:306 start_codon:yes stop_codon:yes gene_type:complete
MKGAFFIYIVGLIIALPITYILYFLFEELFNLKDSDIAKSIVFGTACAPTIIEYGENQRNEVIVLGLYAIWKGQNIETTLWFILGTVVFIYASSKFNKKSK